ncbi:hypothetical protein [Oerskovia merdavium]|uniref:Phage head morphogenesis domain-containing protein n=1 Tax=Oerskovia merdavium TaxID=2762227 RepID=A0ABR8TWB1_9CELL|nr:hypothetical protein [Oerskovia merdavium]MBD7980037.1 hypothetical protein [Oerskovia merdavium]
MTYRDKLHLLAGDVEAKVLDIFGEYSVGRITQPVAVRLIAVVIAKGNARAVALADIAFAANMMLALGQPVPVLGLVPRPGEVERLTKAAQTLLSIQGVTSERVARLGRVEPLNTAVTTYSEAMQKRAGNVKGWTRNMSADPCQLCTWWSREGRVWPASHPMQHHKGCTCTQSVVFVDKVEETEYTRKQARLAAGVENRKRSDLWIDKQRAKEATK